MDKYSVENTYEALRRKMLDYVKTVYLGKNIDLLDACKSDLEQNLSLSQEPFIEANPAYKEEANGIFEIPSSILPDYMKSFYEKMINANLGVFRNPYTHQIKALESYYLNKDLLVATGTGSGKTECFMWPIAGKLFQEAYMSPETWGQRGVRALMLYPMNALVSDQIGRLRKMIGDDEGCFESIFTSVNARRPQFGMYTGRTPYSGDESDKEDKKLAETIEFNLLSCAESTKVGLKRINKYPAKVDLSGFVAGLKKGIHKTNPSDAELMTRKEMQNNCPDILVTNYSMLEYMLIRPIEKTIWEKTREWLKKSEKNKLLIVIDEAHMYRGSAGGEVALLIRRLMHRLGVGRDRFQFILTTASVPTYDDSKIQSFAKALSGKTAGDDFEIVRGTEEILSENGLINYPASRILDISIDAVVSEKEIRNKELQKFADCMGYTYDSVDFQKDSDVEIWLYNMLVKNAPVVAMIKKCRGNATKLEELSKIAFPNDDTSDAIKAATILLAIAPLAKKDGRVLFPARLHLMFRGLQGLYACTNPNCSCKGARENNHLPLGKIYLDKEVDVCSCGGKVFELLNDRSCGALFIRGYVEAKYADGNTYIWSERGTDNDDLKEIVFYLLASDEILDRDQMGASGLRVRTGWLNCISGRLYTDDTKSDDPHCLHVAYYVPEDNTDLVFKLCPRCFRERLEITNFSTKGNEPFFNLVSEQLNTQPPRLFSQEDKRRIPNQGRKVLLFSDSRQKAARLARDLTKSADEDAMKKALTIAAKELQEWSLRNNSEPSMNLLYPFIVKIAAVNGLRFFYGDDEVSINEHVYKYEKEEKACEYMQEEVDFNDLEKVLKPVPSQFYVQLLIQICHSYRSLSDAALCWIKPTEKTTKRLVYELNQNGIQLTKEQVIEVYSAWVSEVLRSRYAYGVDPNMEDYRKTAASRDRRWGIDAKTIIKKQLRNLIKEKTGLSDEQMVLLGKAFLNYTTNLVGERYYINPSMVSLVYAPYPESEWVICPRCKVISHSGIGGRCYRCTKSDVVKLDDKAIEGVSFWRNPVLNAINHKEDEIITGINAEEHTAQLSHKDQVNSKMYSTTEQFEMQFQNVFPSDNAKPVDVLSCTTTMEVGIDIGSLTAVGLRNIPPKRENYQQRAGRAGRKSASVSTIVTYIDDGPHDNYYFIHPQEIISGQPSMPWIDSNNTKLVKRHLNMVMLNDYFLSRDTSLDSVDIETFFNEFFEDFSVYLNQQEFDEKEKTSLIPQGMEDCLQNYKADLRSLLSKIQKKLDDFPEKYMDDRSKPSTVLDVMYQEGVMPTYSFPKDVVGFYIEEPDGSAIKEKPERSLDLAITEYAPGRTLVVNKKTYKSGGLYSYHAKKMCGKGNNPAKKYLESREYVSRLYLCKNKACQWFSTELPRNNRCPFCGQQDIQSKDLVKPWGFAPINGTHLSDTDADNEPSYAENPCYAATPNDPMTGIQGFKNVMYSKRADQKLLVINKGVKNVGFLVCRKCGAAVSADISDTGAFNDIDKPFRNPANGRHCFHDPMSVFIGTDVGTDMVVYQFALPNHVVNTSFDDYWISQAAVTLSEALVLCASRLLEIEFDEIRSGYRIRYDNSTTYLDVFLFDSLSSGAGYCALIADQSKELFDSTKSFLEKCTCETTCHKCLNHFGNQRYQGKMDRHAAIDVLNWCINEKLPDELSESESEKLFRPLCEIINNDEDLSISLEKSGGKYYVVKSGIKRQLYFYPAMWMPYNEQIPNESIAISDLSVRKALPKVYSRIIGEFKGSPITIHRRFPDLPSKSSVRYSDGIDLSDESYAYIWEYIEDDIESIEYIDRIKAKMSKDDSLYEKPIYKPNLVVDVNGKNLSGKAVLLWRTKKVVMITKNSIFEDALIRNDEWNFFCVEDMSDDDINQFIQLIEV